MKKSLIWITAGIAAIGFAVPAFAAHGDSPSDLVPARVTIATPTPVTVGDDNVTTNSVDDNVTTNSVTTNSVEDISGPCDEAEHANDPRCTGVDLAVTDDSVDDSVTTNSVEDISGPCDEAEHATDPRCTGVAGTSTVDDSGHDANDDSSGRHGGNDDSGHGSDDD